MKTEIFGTFGPACDSRETLKQMIEVPLILEQGETVIGRYPVEVIKYLANTAREAERN